MWQCGRCQEQVEDNFEVCWNCGSSRDGSEDPDFQKADDVPAESQTDAADFSDPATDKPTEKNQVRRKRWLSVRNLILIAGLISGIFVLDCCTHFMGDGRFDQEIIFQTEKPIAKVSYCTWTVDDELRYLVETTSDPKYFEWRETEKRGENWFSASIRYAINGGLVRGRQVSHAKHLIVFVEFEDGSRACRVIDFPQGRGREEVVIDLR